jgi:2,3-bisphosphoglycerate-dependent phosphoglycerate mutase
MNALRPGGCASVSRSAPARQPDPQGETESMPDVVVVRHAAASGQSSDAALTTEGQRQAAALAGLLLPLGIERVISSPSRRAIQSTAPFCARAGLRVELEPCLVERVLSARDLPDWREHLRRSFDDPEYRVGDGESSRAAQERGTAVLRAALASGRRCVLVTHGNLLALILRSVDASAGFDFWSRLSNPDAFIIHVDDRGPRGFSRIWQPGGPASSCR